MGIEPMRSWEDVPGFWKNETGGELRGAVETYLCGRPITREQVALLRAYLRQSINAPGLQGPAIEVLRVSVNTLCTQIDVDHWLDRALDAGVDPL
jgi:hypothetical protein